MAGWRPTLSAVVAIAVVASAACGNGDDGQPSVGGDHTETATAGATTILAAETTTTAAETTTTAAETTTTEAPLPEIPDVVGLHRDEAVSEVGDAGFAPLVVETEGTVPFDEVVRTEPAGGTEAEAGDTVELFVNIPPELMPSVEGETLSRAEETLASYGIEYTITDVLAEDGIPNSVAEQTPPGGSPFTESVELAVVRRPTVTFIRDLDAVEGRFDRDPAQLNGITYSQPITVIVPNHRPLGERNVVDFDLARRHVRLLGSVGPRDDAPFDAVFKIEIVADGVTIFEETSGLGEEHIIDLDVSGILRLQLAVTMVEGRSTPPKHVVFADLRAWAMD